MVSNPADQRSKWKLDTGKKSFIDFAVTDNSAGAKRFDIAGLLFVAPEEDIDLAILSITSAAATLPEPLTLDWQPNAVGRDLPQANGNPPVFQGREIYVVGHPFRRRHSELVVSIFGVADGMKRLSPGLVKSIDREKPLLEHDCSTLGGNSGSCVFTADTHEVVGLHVGGLDVVEETAKGRANLAISSFAFAGSQGSRNHSRLRKEAKVGDAETITEISLNKDQLDDLAWLLAKTRNLGDIFRLGQRFLDADAVNNAANDVSNVDAFAQKIVQAMQAKNVVPAAVTWLRTESHPSGRMAVGLRSILAGNRLNSEEALQALVNEYEPFLSSAGMIDLMPKIAGRVCAIALGTPYRQFKGSGFLVAPDVVITNFHVLEPFLDKDETTGEYKAREPGNQIFFFFDYLSGSKPDVPPADDDGHICVTAADDWFVCGRERLLDDGMPTCPKEVKNNELDYVLIKLARPLGALQARTGGGAMRGWLPLEDFIDIENAGKRILVVQHPEAMPQLLDIGDYAGMDPSGTRVRYSVSTAKGSSGGAAIGTDGRLFALHNAEVKQNNNGPLGVKRVNQGVRIDLICKDIGARLPKVPVPAGR